MALTLDEANRIIQGAIAKAKALNITINVAVCDAGGRLIAFNRMDGAIWAGVYGSQGKAIASAAFGRTSGDMQARADSPIFRGIIAADGRAQLVDQRQDLVRRLAVTLEQLESAGPHLTEERSLPIAEPGARAAEDRGERPVCRHRDGRTTRQSAPRDLIAWQMRPALSA